MGEKETSREKRFKAKRRDDWAFSPGEQAVTFILHPCGLDIQSGILPPELTVHHKIFLDVNNIATLLLEDAGSWKGRAVNDL